MKRNRLWIVAALMATMLSGCHTQKKTEGQDADATMAGEAGPTDPLLLLLTGTFSHDSTTNAYHLDISSQRVIEGSLNLMDDLD